MAGITDYNDLKSTIASYLHRSDLTNLIPDFIQWAEVRLRRELRMRKMLKFVTTTVTSTDGTVGLPSDFLEVRELYFASNPLQNVQYESPGEFFRTAGVLLSGETRYFTILDNEFRFSPIPTEDTLNMLYYAAPPYLSDTQTSNVFLANCPDLLLFGALAEAATYIQDDQALQRWRAMYDRGLGALQVSDNNSKYPSAPLKVNAR